MRKTLLVAVCMLVTAMLFAQTTWTGAASADWADAANWTSGVPDAATDAIIADNAAQNPEVVSAAVCKSLTLQGGPNPRSVRVSIGFSLAVAGAITIEAITGDGVTKDVTVAGVLNCNSVRMLANGPNFRVSSLRITSTGVVNVAGDIVMDDVSVSRLRNTVFIDPTGGVLNIGGTLNGGGQVQPGNGTVNFNSKTAPQVVPAVYNYTNLNVINGGSANPKSLAGDLVNQGDFAVDSGAYFLLGATNLTLAGNFPAGIFSSNGAHLVVNGTGQLLPTGSNKRLVVDPGAYLDLEAPGSEIPAGFRDYLFAPQSYQVFKAAGNQPIATHTYGNLVTGGSGDKTISADLTANSISIGAGTNLAPGGSLVTINGTDGTSNSSFANGGTFTQGTSTVRFNGILAQYITTPATFYNLEVNKPATGTTPIPATERVGAAGNIDVQNTLSLTSGFISMGTNQLLLSNATAASQLIGGDDASYVIADGAGRLRRNNLAAGSANLFPVGTLNYYLPARVNGLSAAADFSSNVFEGATTNGVRGGPAFSSKSEIVDAVWNVDKVSAPAATADLILQWVTALEGSNFTTFANNGIGISKNISGAWQLATADAADNAANTAQENFTTFSPFGVGTINQVLPLRFGDVWAREKRGGVEVSWQTFDESALIDFSVERSVDGRIYSEIGRVAASNAAAGNYVFFDARPLSGVNYYRVRSNEVAGKVAYSKFVRLVIVSGDKSFVLYPNPLTDRTLNIAAGALDRGDCRIRIYNATGQDILNVQWKHDGGPVAKKLSLPAQAPTGMYFLEIRQGNAALQKMSFLVK